MKTVSMYLFALLCVLLVAGLYLQSRRFATYIDPTWGNMAIVESYICDRNYALTNGLLSSIPLGKNVVLACSLGNFTHKRVCATLYYVHTDQQHVDLSITNPAMGNYTMYTKSFASTDEIVGRKEVVLIKGRISSK